MSAVLGKGMIMRSKKRRLNIIKNREIVAVGFKSKGEKLYSMKFEVRGELTACVAEYMENESKLWHERLAHQNFAHVSDFLKENGVKVNQKENFCSDCVLGKMSRKPFPLSESQTTRVAELIHADVCGPMEIVSIGKSRYFLLFKDDFSGYLKIYFLENKSDVKDCFKNYIKRVENETGNKINVLRTDNGLEFVNNSMTEITFENGIEHQRTVTYTPQQNGKAERENRT